MTETITILTILWLILLYDRLYGLRRLYRRYFGGVRIARECTKFVNRCK